MVLSSVLDVTRILSTEPDLNGAVQSVHDVLTFLKFCRGVAGTMLIREEIFAGKKGDVLDNEDRS
jgi:hypothetical protein